MMRVSIVYDGKCPICSRVVQASRLRKRNTELDLINVRNQSVSNVQGQDLSGLDFDEGFVLVVDGVVHHGAEGARVLAVLTEPSGLLFSLFRWLVGTENRSRLFYPVLRAGRNLLLRILGIPKIQHGRETRE